jgi:YjbE family integral membrane protein
MQDVWVIIQIILLDLALGGDNSAVIGMAARNLPPKLQKKAIFIGTFGALAARFILAFAAVWLLQIPYLKTAGALILIWIGAKLIGEKDAEKTEEVESGATLGAAVRTIIVADVVMSLDNVLAIVGASGGHMGMLIFGMLISVPIIVFGSTVVVKLMNRYTWLIYAGGMVLGWAAGGMMATDASFPMLASWDMFLKTGGVIIVLAAGILWNRMANGNG